MSTRVYVKPPTTMGCRAADSTDAFDGRFGGLEALSLGPVFAGLWAGTAAVQIGVGLNGLDADPPPLPCDGAGSVSITGSSKAYVIPPTTTGGSSEFAGIACTRSEVVSGRPATTFGFSAGCGRSVKVKAPLPA